MSRIRRISPRLSRGGLLGNTEGPEAYLRELDTLPSQFCRATGGTETVIEEGDAAVSLLLNFDGSNGSTTFTDQSIYAHTVTANGDSEISTTQSKFGGSSAAFDGTGDYLSVPDSSQFEFNSGDFTIECWVFFDALSSNRLLVDKWTSGQTGGWQIYWRSSGSSIAFFVGSSVILQDPSPGTIATNTWYHVAVARSGSTAKLFIDGAEKASATLTTSLNNTSDLSIGNQKSTLTNYFNGYIDSLRITKGKALYTGNFTPPASAPTNKTGKYYRVHTFTDTDPTSLLLNFDGSNGSTTFTDDSGWGHAVTANGDAQISTTQSKFGGSSGYFDGNGDYLSVADSSQFEFGGGDFTIEGWFFIAGNSPLNGIGLRYAALVYKWPTSGTISGFTVVIEGDSTTTGTGISFEGYSAGSAVFATSYSGTITQTEWHHFACCRNGSTTKVFIDGTEGASSTGVSGSIPDTAHNLTVGISPNSGGFPHPFNGYIDSLRITKGQALYTAAFTPPTTALARVGSGSLTFTRGGAVEYLVVGGGGAGGGGVGFGSGGGAGGFRAGNRLSVIAGADYEALVGGGGASSNANGSSSSLSGITSAGGAGGKSGSGINGGDGASGSGGCGTNGATAGTGGSGNVPAVSPSQGSDGGDGFAHPSTNWGSGGGGGAASAGGNGSTSQGGNGGNGASSAISGTSTTYAGGGGGAAGSGSGGAGGSGGGGAGSFSTSGTNGTANTGGGGGGGFSANAGGDGGSGIVIARYRITQAEYQSDENFPFTIEGLQLWLDASDASTLYDSTTGGALVAADGGVARWEDKSGNGRHFTQPTAGSRPLRKTGEINGLDVVRFDGSNDILTSAAFSFPAAATAVMVVKANNWTTPGGYRHFLVHGYDPTPPDSGLNVGISFFNQTGGAIAGWQSGDVAAFGNGYNTGQSPRAAGPTTAGSDYRVVSTVLSSSVADIYVNNTLVSTRLSDTGSAINTAKSYAMGVGNVLGVTEAWDGDACEIIVYHKALSSVERQAVQNYLSAKWGIAIA